MRKRVKMMLLSNTYFNSPYNVIYLFDVSDSIKKFKKKNTLFLYFNSLSPIVQLKHFFKK